MKEEIPTNTFDEMIYFLNKNNKEQSSINYLPGFSTKERGLITINQEKLIIPVTKTMNPEELKNFLQKYQQEFNSLSVIFPAYVFEKNVPKINNIIYEEEKSKLQMLSEIEEKVLDFYDNQKNNKRNIYYFDNGLIMSNETKYKPTIRGLKLIKHEVQKAINPMNDMEVDIKFVNGEYPRYIVENTSLIKGKFKCENNHFYKV